MAGRRIDDHNAFMGKPTKQCAMPEGVHVKSYSSVEGAGAPAEYEDTTEKIALQQRVGKEKAKSLPLKVPNRY